MNKLTLSIKCQNDSVKELYTDVVTKYQNESIDDAGFDLKFPETLSLKPHSSTKIDLGIATQMFISNCTSKTKSDSESESESETGSGRSVRTSYYLYPRSSISKTPLRLANGTGIIDRGYTGNLLVVVDNISDKEYIIERGNRLFQLCGPHLFSVFTSINLVDSLDKTTRGSGGFGSTGK